MKERRSMMHPADWAIGAIEAIAVAKLMKVGRILGEAAYDRFHVGEFLNR